MGGEGGEGEGGGESGGGGGGALGYSILDGRKEEASLLLSFIPQEGLHSAMGHSQNTATDPATQHYTT